MMIAIGLFLLAGLAEIAGGYLVWLWLRESKPLWYGLAGGLTLIIYGVIRLFRHFHRSGASMPRTGAYLLFWLCFGGGLVDKKTPDLYDWAGAVICLAGVSVMLWAPRG